jgi:histidinol-phosphate phosphatase family protein
MRAVFLDRDGCLNDDWFNPATGAWESPMSPADLVLRPGAVPALRRLRADGWALFLVSNQPSFAKGKCRLEDLHAVHARFAGLMDEAGVAFQDYYYSHRHPDGVVPGYSGPSPDRKPSPYFLHLAVERHGVDLAASWVVGDRDSDVAFGRRGGVRTIQVANPRAGAYAGRERPDHRADDILAAAEIILQSLVRDPDALAR